MHLDASVWGAGALVYMLWLSALFAISPSGVYVLEKQGGKMERNVLSILGSYDSILLTLGFQNAPESPAARTTISDV